jgi:hypothetical protein
MGRTRKHPHAWWDEMLASGWTFITPAGDVFRKKPDHKEPDERDAMPIKDARLSAPRVEELYELAHAGAWDGDPRATVLVEAIRDLLSERYELLRQAAPRPTIDPVLDADLNPFDR